MNTTHSLDAKASLLAKTYLKTEVELLTVLMEMKRRRLFDELDYSGIFDYCERRLNFSRSQSFYLKSVAEKSVEVPALKQALVTGELTLSQARRIVPVITKENQSLWIEKAGSLRQAELEREVTIANPKAHIQDRIKPVAPDLSELKVAVDPETEANLHALKESLSQKLQRPATLADVIAWSAEITRDKFDPIRKAKRARAKAAAPAARRSPATSKNSVPTRRPAGIAPSTPVEPFASRPEIISSRKPTPAKVLHEVRLRDDFRCTHVSSNGQRCTQIRWLDCHHVIEVHRGGRNTVENLQLLCRLHHRARH